MRKPPVSATLAGLLVAVLLLSGCLSAAKCVGEQAWQGQDGVCNQENSFAYGGQLTNETDNETYTWRNTRGQANVHWGGQGSGEVQLTIGDAVGQQVYQTTFTGGQAGGSESTQTGEAGDWTIHLAFGGFSGQMGLSIQATNATGG